jgi:hypothetical protein
MIFFREDCFGMVFRYGKGAEEGLEQGGVAGFKEVAVGFDEAAMIAEELADVAEDLRIVAVFDGIAGAFRLAFGRFRAGGFFPRFPFADRLGLTAALLGSPLTHLRASFLRGLPVFMIGINVYFVNLFLVWR